MTARFGRNKRRAAREALAAAWAEIAARDHLISTARQHTADLRRRLGELEDLVDELIERVVAAVGVDSGLIPFKRTPRRYNLDYMPERWAVPRRVIADNFSFFEVPGQPSVDIGEWTVNLVELVLRMDQEPDPFKRVIRVLVKHPLYDEFEGHAAILVDRDSFRRRGGLSERDVDMLFDMYREQLRSFIAGGGMRPRKPAEVRRG